MPEFEYLRKQTEADDLNDHWSEEKLYFSPTRADHFRDAEAEKAQLKIVKIARDFIHNNFATKISVDQISREVFVSQYHFSRIFKKHTNFSPYQYLLYVRLQHAKKLMHQRELSIKEITFQSGFSSIDHFSAAFAKKYTMCPTSYRRKLRS